mgnify:FL=1
MMFGNPSNKKNIYLFCLFLIFVFFDQLSKLLIINNFKLYQSQYLTPFLDLTFVVNYGFAFGFLNNPSLNQVIVSMVIFSIIAYFLYLLIKTQDQIFRYSLILILSGATGNFIDRVFRGYVIDFIDIHISQYHWPAFNIADSCITIGFMIMMFNILFLNRKI